MAKLTKKQKEALSKVEKNKIYNLDEASALVKEVNFAKFDASVDIAVRLGVDPRKANQMVRGVVSLPHGTGKTIRVAVFAPEADHKAAKAAGADIVGDEELIKQLDKQEINFDILVATPQFMPRLGK